MKRILLILSVFISSVCYSQFDTHKFYETSYSDLSSREDRLSYHAYYWDSANFSLVKVYDTLPLVVKELDSVDEKLTLCLDDFVKEFRREKHFLPKSDDAIIFMDVFFLRSYYRPILASVAGNMISLSLKEKFDNLKNSNYFVNGFHIGTRFLFFDTPDLESDAWPQEENILSWFQEVKPCHFKYKRWDVFIVPHGEGLEMPYSSVEQEFVFQYETSKFVLDPEGKFHYDDVLNELEQINIKNLRERGYYLDYIISQDEVIRTSMERLYKADNWQ